MAASSSTAISDDELAVWDSITGGTHYVSAPPSLVGVDVAAALVCAAGHGDLLGLQGGVMTQLKA
jgi:hypothetical protein